LPEPALVSQALGPWLLRKSQPVLGRPTPQAEAQIAQQAVRRGLRYECPFQAPVVKKEPPPILLMPHSP
jgi:hypothetical protein